METSVRPPLPDVSRFFEEAWRVFRARIWRLLGIGGAGSIAALALSLVPIAIGGAAAAASSASPTLIWGLAGAASLSILLWLMSWVQASMLECALADDAAAGAWDCCRRAWPKTAAFSGVCVLYVLLVLGGFCLLGLPGLYLSVALLFAPIACVGEGVEGLAALRLSLDDTAGRFIPLATRLTMTGLATSLPGLIPGIGWLLSAMTGPFSLVALAVLYKQLKAEPRARPSGRGWVLGLAAAGLLVPVGLSFVVVPRLIEQAPRLLEAGKRLSEAGQDPEKLQKALAVLENGDASTLEQVSTAVNLVSGAESANAVSTAPVAVPPASPPEPAPSK